MLYLNREEDRAWIINFTGWFASIFIDLPEIAGMGAIVATIHIVAWLLGVALTGGGILTVLAALGSALGGIPGIPAVVMGVIYLAIVFSTASSLMASVWS